jgi:hypothetical protein
MLTQRKGEFPDKSRGLSWPPSGTAGETKGVWTEERRKGAIWIEIRLGFTAKEPNGSKLGVGGD